jgi:uncharacterized membrane protein
MEYRSALVSKVGSLVAYCLPFLLLHACNFIPDTQSKIPESAKTFVFLCPDGYEFVARAENESVWLFLPSGTLKLEKESADNFRSENLLFTLKDDMSLLEESGVEHQDCRNNRRQAIWEHAKLNGADFRAIGNEPGWNLEIHNKSKLILVTDYGSKRREFDLSEPETDQTARTTRYKFKQDEHEMSLVISGESCSDSMSGERFESRVEVILNGLTLRGCGRPLH